VTEIEIRLRKLHPAQQQIRAEARRFNVVSCGRRFGKTDFGLDEAIDGKKGLLEGYPVGWFAPNSRYYEEAWVAAVRTWRPSPRASRSRRSASRCMNGAVFECWDLEDPDAGRSRKYGKVIIDEAAKAKKLKDAWEQAIAAHARRLRRQRVVPLLAQGLQLLQDAARPRRTRTPGQREGAPEWMSWVFSSYANPHVPREEIDRIAAEMPELVRRQEIMGQFVDLSGASVHREWVKYGDAFPHLVPHTKAIGVDLAISLKDSAAYTAIVVLARLPMAGSSCWP
jgi:hypothetical protein